MQNKVGYKFNKGEEPKTRLTEEEIKAINQRIQELWDQMEKRRKTVFDSKEEDTE